MELAPNKTMTREQREQNHDKEAQRSAPPPTGSPRVNGPDWVIVADWVISTREESPALVEWCQTGGSLLAVEKPLPTR